MKALRPQLYLLWNRFPHQIWGFMQGFLLSLLPPHYLLFLPLKELKKRGFSFSSASLSFLEDGEDEEVFDLGVAFRCLGFPLLLLCCTPMSLHKGVGFCKIFSVFFFEIAHNIPTLPLSQLCFSTGFKPSAAHQLHKSRFAALSIGQGSSRLSPSGSCLPMLPGEC